MTALRTTAQQALEALEDLRVWRVKQSMAITALRAALAEPVAWMVYTLDGKSVCVTDNPADFGEGHRALPLYTAPPQRTMVPLTEEEIERIARDCLDAWSCTRAVEAAHGIKVVEEGK